MPHLSPELRKRFKKPKKAEVPKKTYSDPKEIAEILEKHKDMPYILLIAKTKEDRKAADETYKSLITLSKKGNLDAKTKLLDYAKFMADNWIDEGGIFTVYNRYPDLLKEKLERCIFYFDENKPQTFVYYLYTSLKGYATDLSKTTKLTELNGSRFTDSTKENSEYTPLRL